MFLRADFKAPKKRRAGLNFPRYADGGTTTSTTSPAPAAGGAIGNVLTGAQNLVAGQPTAPVYTGNPAAAGLNANLLAPLTANQNEAIQGIQDYQGAAIPFLGAAANYTAAGAAPIAGNVGLATPGSLSSTYGAGTGAIAGGLNYLPTAGGIIGQGASTLGQGTGYLQAGQGLINQGAQAALNMPQFSADQINKYMSPYTSSVLQTTLQQIDQQNAQQASQLQSKAIGSGAFGSDRAGLAMSDLAHQQNMSRDQTIASILQGGYGQALGEFNSQQQAGLQQAGALAGMGSQTGNFAGLNTGIGTGLVGAGAGYGGIGGMSANIGSGLVGATTNEQNIAGNVYGSDASRLANAAMQSGVIGQETLSTGLQGANALLGAGTLQQQQQQQALNIPYLQWQQQQAWPYQQLGWESGIVGQQAGALGGTSSTTVPSPSLLSQIGGVGTTALGGLGLLNQAGALKGLNPFGGSTNNNATGGDTSLSGGGGGGDVGGGGFGTGTTFGTGGGYITGNYFYPGYAEGGRVGQLLYSNGGRRRRKAGGGALSIDPTTALDMSRGIADAVTGPGTDVSAPSSVSAGPGPSFSSIGDRALGIGSSVGKNMAINAIASAIGVPAAAIGAGLNIGLSINDMSNLSSDAQKGGLPGATIGDYAINALTAVDPTRPVVDIVNSLIGTNIPSAMQAALGTSTDKENSQIDKAIESAKLSAQSYDDLNNAASSFHDMTTKGDTTSTDGTSAEGRATDETGGDARGDRDNFGSGMAGGSMGGGSSYGGDSGGYGGGSSGGGYATGGRTGQLLYHTPRGLRAHGGRTWLDSRGLSFRVPRSHLVHKDGGGGLNADDAMLDKTYAMAPPQALSIMARMMPADSPEGRAAREALLYRSMGSSGAAALDAPEEYVASDAAGLQQPANSNVAPRMTGTYAYGGGVAPAMPYLGGSLGPSPASPMARGPVASMPGAGMPMRSMQGTVAPLMARGGRAGLAMRRHFDDGGDVDPADDGDVFGPPAPTDEDLRRMRASPFYDPKPGSAALGSVRTTQQGAGGSFVDNVRSIVDALTRPQDRPLLHPSLSKATPPVQIIPSAAAAEMPASPAPDAAAPPDASAAAIISSGGSGVDDDAVPIAPDHPDDATPPPAAVIRTTDGGVQRVSGEIPDAPGDAAAPPAAAIPARRVAASPSPGGVETRVAPSPASAGPAPTLTMPTFDTADLDRAVAPPRAANRNGGLGDVMSSPWMAALVGGLSLMSGQSPYAGVNLGNAGLNAVKFLGQQQAVQQKQSQTQAEQDYRDRQLGETSSYHSGVLANTKAKTQADADRAAAQLSAQAEHYRQQEKHQGSQEEIARTRLDNERLHQGATEEIERDRLNQGQFETAGPELDATGKPTGNTVLIDRRTGTPKVITGVVGPKAGTNRSSVLAEGMPWGEAMKQAAQDAPPPASFPSPADQQKWITDRATFLAQPKPKPQAPPSPLDQARDAINRGAPRDAVIQRLKDAGIDPGPLDAP